MRHARRDGLVNVLWEVGRDPSSIPGLPDPDPIPQLAAAIAAARERLGITQEEVSRRSDVHFVEVSRIEHGKRDIRVTTLIRLARALETTASELLDNID